jgi:hypothetical protein
MIKTNKKIVFANGFYLVITKNNYLLSKSESELFYFRFMKSFHNKPHSRNQNAEHETIINHHGEFSRQIPAQNKNGLRHNFNNGKSWNTTLNFSDYENLMGVIDVYKSGLISKLKSLCGSYKVVNG